MSRIARFFVCFYFILFSDRDFHLVQAGFRLAVELRLPSQSAGISRVSHHTCLRFPFSSFLLFELLREDQNKRATGYCFTSHTKLACQ